MNTLKAKPGYEASLNDYVKQERAAVDIINSVGSLMYDKGVELVMFRNNLVNITISEVIGLIDYGKDVVSKPIDLYTSAEIAKAMLALDLAPSKIDIGKLAANWMEQSEFKTIEEFLDSVLSGFLLDKANNAEPRDVVLFGFGRIGRTIMRIAKLRKHYDVVAVNDLASPDQLAYAFKYDLSLIHI